MSQSVAPELYPLNALPANTRPHAQDVLLFNALQDRHVPATPRLIRSLHIMQTSDEPASVPPWGIAYEHAGAAIGLSGRFGRSSHWASMTDHFVTNLAEPLLRQAAINLGRAFITQFNRSEPTAQEFAGAAAACAALEQEVDRLLATPSAMPRGFWSYAGLSLFSASRNRTAPDRRNRARSTRVNSTLSRLVYDIEPILPGSSQWQRRQQKSTLRSSSHRSGIRPREGGVTGVIHSRRLEDVDSALSSTFAYPRELMVSRLLEEGFLITHRPPKRKPNRDMLFIVLNDASTDDGPASVAKAAWIDATLRLSLLLKKAQMPRTEFGWSDVAFGGTIATALSLEAFERDAQLAISGAAAAAALAGPLRHAMISRSSLVPDAFASLPSLDLSALPAEQRLRRATQDLVASALATANAGDLLPGRMPNNGEQRARDLSDYAVVYLLRIGPAALGDGPNQPLREIDWVRDRARILRDTAIETRGRLVAGEMLVPPLIAPGQRISLASDAAPQALHIDVPEEAGTPDDGLAELIGALSDWMIGEILQALHAG